MLSEPTTQPPGERPGRARRAAGLQVGGGHVVEHRQAHAAGERPSANGRAVASSLTTWTLVPMKRAASWVARSGSSSTAVSEAVIVCRTVGGLAGARPDLDHVVAEVGRVEVAERPRQHEVEDRVRPHVARARHPVLLVHRGIRSPKAIRARRRGSHDDVAQAQRALGEWEVGRDAGGGERAIRPPRSVIVTSHATPSGSAGWSTSTRAISGVADDREDRRLALDDVGGEPDDVGEEVQRRPEVADLQRRP